MLAEFKYKAKLVVIVLGKQTQITTRLTDMWFIFFYCSQNWTLAVLNVDQLQVIPKYWLANINKTLNYTYKSRYLYSPLLPLHLPCYEPSQWSPSILHVSTYVPLIISFQLRPSFIFTHIKLSPSHLRFPINFLNDDFITAPNLNASTIFHVFSQQKLFLEDPTCS